MLENLNNLERRVFRTYWEDGLLDVMAAVGVLIIGLFWLRDLPVAAAIVPALMVPIWSPLRQKLIEPRLGLVEFGDQRTSRNARNLRWVMYGGIATLVLFLELYFLRDSLTLPGTTFIAGLPAMLLGVLAVLTAALIGSPRFLGYAAILVVAALAGAVRGWTPGLILTVSGGAMLVIASTTLVRFLLRNPADPGPLD
ncbi:MAG: hypothetical protein QNJ40_13045 [Xanthomonadales bacterium]|nr:hypothetical protein [Xanthomonadales bacterium]